MAGQGATRIDDIVVPEVYLDYFYETCDDKSILIQSGIVQRDTVMEAQVRKQAGGDTVYVPFWQKLSGDAEVINSGTGSTDSELTVDNLTADKDRAAVLFRGKAFGADDIVSLLSGADPMKAIADMEVAYWNDQEQDILINVLTGVFASNATNNSSDQISDISTADGDNATDDNLIGPDAIIDACQKLGDMGDKLTAIACHSKPFSRLQKLNLIDFVPMGEQNIMVPYYMGKRVIVDDDCDSCDGATSGTRYATYLFGEGAIARVELDCKVPVEVYRQALASQDVFIRRRAFILHPRGYQYQKSTISGDTPTNAELAESAQWTRKFQKKNIPLVKLVTNG